jgi:hypothetical protein
VDRRDATAFVSRCEGATSDASRVGGSSHTVGSVELYRGLAHVHHARHLPVREPLGHLAGHLQLTL